MRSYRPRQWTKNLLVLAAPAAAGVIDRPLVIAQLAATFVALCLLSSATYLFNDVRDCEHDRLHRLKRLRPIAAGELPPGRAVALAALTALAGLAIATAVDVKVGAIGLCYLALTTSYSLWWRRVVVLDVLAIAAGFVLRALAGGVATDIYLSRWFVIVTAACAIFVVAAKRYAELRDRPDARPARATLRRYSLPGLRLALLGAAAVAASAYVAWAVTRPQNVVLYVLSAAPFLVLLTRYSRLIAAGAGQAPEDLLNDRQLLALLFVWGVLFLGGVYVGH
ncbi:MAG TPA: decaprenyl-phosphate phosphoribosyltransferase [Solirubrobacteraceae bacterium]|nr:decaprenyl-phosphate phosphoribosyltransferase [Solirubrobacteraceae bacterium]